MDLPSGPGSILIIVSRDEPWLYQVLKDQLAGDARVEILFDRRFGERRQQDLQPTSERRRQERRQSDISNTLCNRGWAVIR